MTRKIEVNLFSYLVHKDPQTAIAIAVPEYEEALLKYAHGDTRIEKLFEEPVGTYEVDLDSEEARMVNRYGAEVVKAVYGLGTSVLKNAIKEQDIHPVKRTAAKAAVAEKAE